ncbi:unnamed protein product [Arabidopsis arenosa]|uniref:SWIM-type domain-containing protein n=1 Tax=Arabidopsis arenosa TaxID=38785 RepID=A0A8S1ZED9_ARAAE|nr:unnamed protein product [Arabidopsis arenosa]
MEVTNELISDMVRVELGNWEKDDGSVWRFKPLPRKEHKHIRFREGDGLAAAKEKVLGEMGIDRTRGKVELTYEMPEWMDVDGAVKPVPIHIATDDDMDMFLAMRVDIHEMKLYVVPMDLTMTLEIDGFKVVPILDEFAFAEVMSKDDVEKERRRRADKAVGDSIICTQVPPEQVADSDDGPLGWVGHTYAAGGFATLSAALRYYKSNTNANEAGRSPVTVLNPESSSSTDDHDLRVTRLTRDLFSEFEKAGSTSGGQVTAAEEDTTAGVQAGMQENVTPTRGAGEQDLPNATINHPPATPMSTMLQLLEIPEHTFARDAAPVIDDTDEEGGERTRLVVLDVDYEGDELFVGRVFKNRDDCKVKIAVHAINRRFSYRNDRTTNDVVIVRCVSDACPWRVYCVRLEDTEYFELRTAMLEHNCPVEVRSQYQRQATTSVISQIMKAKYAGAALGPNPIGIQRALMDEYSVNVSYWKAWRARELAVDMAKGSTTGSYGILPAYLHMLSKANVYPRAAHGACIVHLQRNVAAKFKQRLLAPLISKAARAFKKTTFTEHFEEIERVSPRCAEYLLAIGWEHWTRSHCNGQRYNIMTSNVAESLNAVLKEARELPIVSTLEYIRATLMTWFSKRREKAALHSMPLTPKVEELVLKNYERGTSYEVIRITPEQYEVKTTTGLSYIVDLHNKTCTCEEFTMVKIPCSHAIAAAVRCDMRVPDLAAPEYGSFFWSLAYNGGIHPVPDLCTLRNVPDGIATLNVLPPLTRRPPGRPKRSRFLSAGECKKKRFRITAYLLEKMMPKNKSSSSGSGSSSTVGDRSIVQREGGFLCYCGKTAVLRQAWTDANPGRRFYRCGEGYKNVCDYFRWRDVEKPYGWQKVALLEARDLIREQAEEIARLRELGTCGGEGDETQQTQEMVARIERLKKENEVLQVALGKMRAKEKMIRTMGMVSLLGFVLGVAAVIHRRSAARMELP